MTAGKRKRGADGRAEDQAESTKMLKVKVGPRSNKAQKTAQDNKGKKADFLSEAHRKWNENFKTRLPQAAREKDPCQKNWPVQLDHCFGRIILDNVIGVDQPWTAKLKSPAIRNMTEEQAEDCSRMAELILAGQVCLVALDDKSLALRGKKPKAK